jgi:hypothetical protein
MYEKELVDMIPAVHEPVRILHMGARNGVGTMKIMDRLRERDVPFDLDIYEYNSKWKFHLSFLVPPQNIYIEWFPEKVYDYILVSDTSLFTERFIHTMVKNATTCVLMVCPKLLKSNIERYMNIKKSIETHYMFGLYMCELYA